MLVAAEFPRSTAGDPFFFSLSIRTSPALSASILSVVVHLKLRLLSSGLASSELHKIILGEDTWMERALT
ncbi:hypothetical protein PIB30_099065, partial [Stylosanthes scabra]|nr:hypothetical protein [Stylosanthes scabra]